MAVKAIPEGLHTITPALYVDGAMEAIEFYKKAFGAEVHGLAMDPTGKKVWHCQLRFGDSAVFINDADPQMGGPATPSRLWIYSDNVDAGFKRALGAGATAMMPPADMFWGDRMGVVKDRWNNQWTLAQHIKDMTPEEMQKAQDAFVAEMSKQKKP